MGQDLIGLSRETLSSLTMAKGIRKRMRNLGTWKSSLTWGHLEGCLPQEPKQLFSPLL